MTDVGDKRLRARLRGGHFFGTQHFVWNHSLFTFFHEAARDSLRITEHRTTPGVLRSICDCLLVAFRGAEWD